MNFMQSKKYDSAALPNGFLVKLNDAGIHLDTVILGAFKRYTLTKKFYDFNNTSQEITYRETWGICIEIPIGTSVQETVRLLSATIGKLAPSPFDNEIYLLYRYKGVM